VVGNDRGTLCRLDSDFRVVQHSLKPLHGEGIHSLVLDDTWVYTRDVVGNITRWSRETLAPADFVVSEHFRAGVPPGVEPIPSPADALTRGRNEVFVANAYGQIAAFDCETFACSRAFSLPDLYWPACINLEHPSRQVLSDTGGQIWECDLDAGTFVKRFSVRGGNMHCVRYDPVHDRYWCTSDWLGGIAICDLEANAIQRVSFTRDDVEEIVFDEGYDFAYAACFDSYIYKIRNSKEPEVVGRIGPFKFQITHLKRSDDGSLIASLESGEIYRVPEGMSSAPKPHFGTDAIWHIDAHDDHYNISLESGAVDRLVPRQDGIGISLTRVPVAQFNRGRVRRTAELRCGDLVCGTADGTVLRAASDGRVKWEVQTGGIVRDIDVRADEARMLACNEEGLLLELDIESGSTHNRLQHSRPIWCTGYTHDGKILFGERSLSYKAWESTEPGEETQFVVLDGENWRPLVQHGLLGNFKRIQRCSDGKMLVNGSGTIGVRFFDSYSLQFSDPFDEWIVNTPENALAVDGRLFVVTYSRQLITYDLASREVVSVLFVNEGFPLGIARLGNHLLVGGRGFYSLYDVSAPEPALYRTWML
jgi:hypothetical protein